MSPHRRWPWMHHNRTTACAVLQFGATLLTPSAVSWHLASTHHGPRSYMQKPVTETCKIGEQMTLNEPVSE